MRGATGARYDQPQTARLRGPGVIIEAVWSAVRRDDPRFITDPQPVEGGRGMPHRLPVGLAAHDDADRASGLAHRLILQRGRKTKQPVTARLYAMMSGSSSLSIFVIRSLSKSFRFFSRCSSSWSTG